MKITLEIDGHEMTFSEQEIISILKEHFESDITEEEFVTGHNEKTDKANCFMVDPTSIDRTYFEEKRNDKKQEKTRKIIMKAFAEVDKDPERYNKIFWTMVPEKTWAWKTVKELQEVSFNLGGHTANWVEQALEWAQRIYNDQNDNGWEKICNQKDPANYYRMIFFGDYLCYVGGSKKCSSDGPSSDIYVVKYKPNVKLDYTVPLVVLYD